MDPSSSNRYPLFTGWQLLQEQNKNKLIWNSLKEIRTISLAKIIWFLLKKVYSDRLVPWMWIPNFQCYEHTFCKWFYFNILCSQQRKVKKFITLLFFYHNSVSTTFFSQLFKPYPFILLRSHRIQIFYL